MISVQICVGSSCHIKGAPEIVSRMRASIADARLEDDIALSGCFCTGQCNRVGVTVTVDGAAYTGVTPDGFEAFWKDTVLPAVKKVKEAP